MNQFFLKPTIKAEPLIWQWYAWPHLIPPLTASCNILERHLKIMNSFVQNPEIHLQAINDPKLLGGPFLDLGIEHVDKIKYLITDTQENCAKLISLCQAYKDMDRILQTEAKGDSLEPIYNKIPLPLKGLVELVYDLNSHPSLRFLEPLIYKKYYSDQYQNISLSDTFDDHRKFVLSTPRFDNEKEVYINVPFSESYLDTLFKMREEPGDPLKLEEIFQIPETKKSLFRSFFTNNPPNRSKDRNYNDKGVRIRYLGHACVLVQTESVSILFDPVISYPTENNDVSRYTFLDLPDFIDYVIITHNHQDHIMFETLLQLRHKIGKIIFPANHWGALEDPSVKLILQHTGFASLAEVRELDCIEIPDGEILALPFFGEHSDLNIQSKLSYYIHIKGKKFIFAADSNNLDPSLYEHIENITGEIDMLFLGMECEGAPLTWLYGPLLSSPFKRSYDRNRTLSGSNYDKAWSIIEKLKCKSVYIYAMGQEPWLNYVMALKYSEESPQIIESNKLINACNERGILCERLFGKREWIVDS